jgi:NAD(P)-dependent dehydrogenase (short-subunit alcohol dehydrogenase family)
MTRLEGKRVLSTGASAGAGLAAVDRLARARSFSSERAGSRKQATRPEAGIHGA